jgi:hypothetical protein
MSGSRPGRVWLAQIVRNSMRTLGLPFPRMPIAAGLYRLGRVLMSDGSSYVLTGALGASWADLSRVKRVVVIERARSCRPPRFLSGRIG